MLLSAAALVAMDSGIYRQEEINTGISSSFANLDPAEKQTRMQGYMMSHPQEMTMMQEAGPKDVEKREGLEGEIQGSAWLLVMAAISSSPGPDTTRFSNI